MLFLGNLIYNPQRTYGQEKDNISFMKERQGGVAMSVKVMVAFSNMLFSEGVCRILKDDDAITIDVLKSGAACPSEKVKSLNPDVILVDFITLYNAFSDMDTAHSKFILLNTECGMDNIVSAILTKKINGVLLGDATPDMLKKAVHAVAKEEIWIDKSTVKNILYGINALDKDNTSALSGREKEIASMIGQGLRNKEIAAKLHISEATVKTHLSHIFQKLGIKNRAQLITFAIKNRNISNSLLMQKETPSSV